MVADFGLYFVGLGCRTVAARRLTPLGARANNVHDLHPGGQRAVAKDARGGATIFEREDERSS